MGSPVCTVLGWLAFGTSLVLAAMVFSGRGDMTFPAAWFLGAAIFCMVAKTG